MTPLTIVCWRWRPMAGYRSTFSPQTVRTLKTMVEKHYAQPHRFVCITDEPEALPDIETIPLWPELANVPSPHAGKNPSCYRRLRVFASDIGALLGERFVSIDLDCVITGNLEPLWDRSEEFVCWGDTNPNNAYNGSMFLLTSGKRPHVWDKFDPATSPKLALKAGKHGSDQAWMSYILSPNEARWGTKDGVYSYRNHLKAQGGRLPKDARVVFWHGAVDPWSPKGQSLDWVRAHWGVAA